MIFLFYSVYFLQTILVAAQDICLPTRCFDSGPVIRFPFRIKGRQPEHCGYPGFDLSCNPINNITEFEFQFPVKASTNKIAIPLSAQASVQEIDYKLQVIHVSVLMDHVYRNRFLLSASQPLLSKCFISIMGKLVAILFSIVLQNHRLISIPARSLALAAQSIKSMPSDHFIRFQNFLCRVV